MVKLHTSKKPANELVDSLVEFLQEQSDLPVLILFSGGSALAILDTLPVDVFDTRHTITVLDERFTYTTEAHNFSQLTATDFYNQVIERGVNVISTALNNNDTKELLAERFEGALESWRQAHPQGIIVAVMGIGEDGHTAGLISGVPSAVMNSTKIIEAFSSTDEKQVYKDRVSVTPVFLQTAIARAFVFVTGEKKHSVLNKIVQLHGEDSTYVASILYHMQAVDIFTNLNV